MIYEPTMKLRFVEQRMAQIVSTDSLGTTNRLEKIKVLQQQYVDVTLGHTEWRDVPTETS